MGISPQVGAAAVAGVFAVANTALTLYVIGRRDRPRDRDMRRAIETEHGDVPEPKDAPETHDA